MSEKSLSTTFETDFQNWQQQVISGPRLYEPLLAALRGGPNGKQRLVCSGYDAAAFNWADREAWEVVVRNATAVVGEHTHDASIEEMEDNSVSAIFQQEFDRASHLRLYEQIRRAQRALVEGGALVLEIHSDPAPKQPAVTGKGEDVGSLCYYILWQLGFQNIAILHRASPASATLRRDARLGNRPALIAIGQKGTQSSNVLSESVARAIETIRFLCLPPAVPSDQMGQLVIPAGMQTRGFSGDDLAEAYNRLQAETRTAEQALAALSNSALTAGDFARRLLKAERRILDLRIKTSILSPLTYPWAFVASKVLRLLHKSREKRRAHAQSRKPASPSDHPAPDVLVVSHARNGTTDIGQRPRILLLKLDHIGDLLLALPAVEILRSAWPGGDFTLVCSPVNEALARSSQLFDRVIPHKFSPELSEDLHKSGVSQYEKIKALLEDTFEISMDLRHDPDTRPHLAFVDSKVKVGFQSHGKYYTPLDISLQPISDQVGLHAPLHNLHRLMLLANHTVNSLSQTPFTTLGKSLIASGTANLPLTTKHYVVFAPGGGTKAKKWPVASFVQLSRLVMESPAVTLVLIGGPAEFEYSAGISRSIGNDRLVDMIGKLPLTDLASVISGAAAFVGTDTGATHLAALLGVPTISIFSGVADVNVWGPLGSNVTTIQTKVGCAPCQISRLEQCVADHACMTLIEPATVYEELLKRARFNDSNRD